MRELEHASYIGLALPRLLARRCYGAESDPVEEFDFEEESSGSDPNKYVWANVAYAMALNVTRSFKRYGWCSRIRGIETGGAVEGLPTHTFPTDDGGVDITSPTEVSISDRREAELAKAGFMPLVHKRDTDVAAFLDAQSLQKKASRPLAEAQIVVEEIDGNPGYYNARFFLRPHHQLEGLTQPIQLVTKLPSAKFR